jgi:hypothetical protein
LRAGNASLELLVVGSSASSISSIINPDFCETVMSDVHNSMSRSSSSRSGSTMTS